MTPVIDINIPLRLLGNATYTSMSSAKEVLSFSWEPKELQEFFFLYAQNTEASALKARNLVQAKIDSQLAVHYNHYPIIADFVDSDEEYGTYPLGAIHTPCTTKKPATESSKPEYPKPSKPSNAPKSSKVTKEMRKKALKKKLPQFVDETLAAFLSSRAEKPVAATEHSHQDEMKPIEICKAHVAEEPKLDTASKPDESVEFEIGLTESRVPSPGSTIQTARPSIFAVLQKSKSTSVGPLPVPALPSLEKLQLNSAFWYNLSMAQKIERPLGFELVHTGLSANASIDRSSNEFDTHSPALFSLAATALKEYNSVLRSIEYVPSVVDNKLIEPVMEEVQLIMPPMMIVESGPSSKTKKHEHRFSRFILVQPGATKKARRQIRKRSRSKKAKKAKKLTRTQALKKTTKVKTTVTFEDLDELVKAEKPKLLERVLQYDVALPELSDEADSDRDIIEVDDLPVYPDADDIEDKKANTLQVGQLSMYHHFMNLIRLAALHAPTSDPSDPEKTINLQVGQLSPYHYFMKLLKLSEDYHRSKNLAEMRRAVTYYHSLGPCHVILSGQAIELPVTTSCEPIFTNEETLPPAELELNPEEDSDGSSENISSEDADKNDTSDSSPVSSPECKPNKCRFSKKPSFPKKVKRIAAAPKTTHVALTSNAKHRRQRAKKAQRNREFSKATSQAPEV